MIIGIISRGKRERSFFRKIKICKVNDEIVVAKIPFVKSNSKKALKMNKRAEKKLKRLKADEIIYEKDLKDKPFDASLVFYKITPKAIRLLAKRFEMDVPFCLSVRQKNPDFNALYIIRELIYEAKTINILTDKTGKALKIQSKVMEEFGAVANCIPYDYVEYSGITVNLDKNEICIFGKWICKDFTVDIEDFGYNLDTLELFYLQNKNFEDIIIKSCVCGKNKLTLNEN